jgi:hypothetical protein
MLLIVTTHYRWSIRGFVCIEVTSIDDFIRSYTFFLSLFCTQTTNGELYPWSWRQSRLAGKTQDWLEGSANLTLLCVLPFTVGCNWIHPGILVWVIDDAGATCSWGGRCWVRSTIMKWLVCICIVDLVTQRTSIILSIHKLYFFFYFRKNILSFWVRTSFGTIFCFFLCKSSRG